MCKHCYLGSMLVYLFQQFTLSTNKAWQRSVLHMAISRGGGKASFKEVTPLPWHLTGGALYEEMLPCHKCYVSGRAGMLEYVLICTRKREWRLVSICDVSPVCNGFC